MGRLGIVDSVDGEVVNVKVEGGFVIQAFRFDGDSPPIVGDAVTVIQTQSTGYQVAVAARDAEPSHQAEPGEKRLYARDGTGSVSCTLWLKGNGSIVATNAAGGSFELEAGGDVVINGTRFSAGGVVSNVTSLAVGGKEINNHTHNVTTAPGVTGPNI